MDQSRESIVKHYREMRAGLLAAIEGLSDEHLSEETLDGWSVKHHLAHLAFWDDLRATEIERISAGHDSVWPATGSWGDALNAMAHGLRHGLSVAQVRWEAATMHQRVLDALAAATPRGLDPALYGEAGLRSTHEEEHTDWIRRWRNERGY